MPAPQNNVKALNWVIISALGFILFVGAAIFFSIYSDRLNLINPSTYFFLLVAIALVAAGFLFGALRSHAAYNGKAYNGTLQLSGPVVVLALIILLGYRFKPSENSFSTTVNLFSSDSNHSPIEAGELKVYYGSAHITRKITEGQVVLSELPKAFRGKEVLFIPEAEGFAITAQKHLIPLNENSLNLYLDKIPDSVTISGIVLTAKGKTVSDVTVVFADGAAKASTDRYGNFRVTLPFKDGSEAQVRVYKNDELRYNNSVRLSNQAPLSIQLNE